MTTKISLIFRPTLKKLAMIAATLLNLLKPQSLKLLRLKNLARLKRSPPSRNLSRTLDFMRSMRPRRKQSAAMLNLRQS